VRLCWRRPGLVFAQSAHHPRDAEAADEAIEQRAGLLRTNRRFMALFGQANVPAGCLLLGVKRENICCRSQKIPIVQLCLAVISLSEFVGERPESSQLSGTCKFVELTRSAR